MVSHIELNKRETMLEKNKKLHLFVTDQLNKSLPIYRWYNYKHSFSKELVISLLDFMGIKKNSDAIVLDPFCGAGTTLLAAKELGIQSIGIDVMPFSTFISKAKTCNYDYENLASANERLKKYLEKKRESLALLKSTKGILLKKYFTPSVLAYVLHINKWVSHQKDKSIQYFYLTALFSILEEVSQVKKDGGFLRFYKRTIREEKVRGLLFEKIASMLDDLKLHSISGPEPVCITTDIRKIMVSVKSPIKISSIDAIITSPPYPNRHDYTRVYGLESILGFSNQEEDIKRIRYETLRSHVEAKRSYQEQNYSPPSMLQSVIKKIEKTNLPNREIIPMLEGYFEDMYYTFKKFYSALKINSFFALVVCDVRYGGIIVPVGQLLNHQAKKAGFQFRKCITARHKNNSAQQMKQYGKSPIGEYILLWQK